MANRKGWDESARQDRLARQQENQDAFRHNEAIDPELLRRMVERTDVAIVEKERQRARQAAGHRHGEAFMLMQYVCVGERTWKDGVSTQTPGCGHREIYWNSRDGVTPFMTDCPSCGGSLQHLMWAYDRYAPGHVPHHGQGVWRDGTPDEAEAIVRHRVEQFRAQGDAERFTPEYVEDLVRRVRDPDDEGNTEFRRGWPMFERHDAFKRKS